MAGIDDVLERLVTDPEFRARLAADPAGALSGYMLYDEDLEVLAATLSADQGSSGALEQRTSKTTLAGLFDAFAGATAGSGEQASADHPYVLGTVPNNAAATEPPDDGSAVDLAGPDPQPGYELKPVLVTSYQKAGTGDSVPGDALAGSPQPEAADFVPEVGDEVLVGAEHDVAIESLKLQHEETEAMEPVTIVAERIQRVAPAPDPAGSPGQNLDLTEGQPDQTGVIGYQHEVISPESAPPAAPESATGEG